VARDFDDIISGPSKLLLTDVDMGHTEGGITATIKPQNRARSVDQFGKSECHILHNGDEVRVMAPLAEYTAAAIAEVYEPGNNQTAAVGAKYMGIGRSAGYIYTAQDLKIVPHLTADAAKKLQFYRATAVGQLKLEYNAAEKDVLFELEFAALVDESKTDGELIGKIHITAS
jgi:hypothetical protein